MPPAGMDVITRQCSLSDIILRELVIKHGQELFDAMVAALTGSTEEAEAAAAAE